MAAPIEAYLHKKLNLNSNSLLIAKFLVNTTPTTGTEWGDGYFNEGDTKAQAETKIKEIFHLDELLKVKSVSPDYFGFIGAVNPNGPNAAYRNINKLSGAKTVTTPLTLSLLTDSLTTKGHCETQSNILKYANLVLNNAFFRSAYYLDSTSFGLKYKINNGNWIVAFNQNLDGEVQPNLGKKLTYSSPLVFHPPAEKGDNIQVKAYIENAEGLFEGNIINFIAEDSIVQVDAIFRTDPQSSSGETSVDFWMLSEQYAALETLTDQGQQSGLFGHTSPYRNVPITSGWYVGILPDKALFVDNTGQFTQYVELAPFQWVLSCGVDLDFPTPESNPIHNGVQFNLNFNAPSNIPINGRISINPEDQPQAGGFTFSGTMLQGTDSLYITTGAGFEYTNSTYYLIVTTPDHPHIQLVGTGQFI